jgi:hypothetical protein
MSLIRKGILIEGPDGETLVREYYIDEKPRNPYGEARRNAIDERNKKVRSFIHRRTSKHEKAYSCQMGYNHCVAHYSAGRRYCRFAGSSFNRDQNLRHEKKKSNVAGGEGTGIEMAYKIAKKYCRRSLPVPREVADYIIRQDPESEGRFRNWLSASSGVPECGISLPIYQLSPRSRGKIRDKATAFFRACPGERVFCTLTFLAPVDDGTGVSLLNKFLTSLRKLFDNLQYLWVAERQENGNIHFHIILNKRLPVRRWNALWVMQQYNAGLIGKTQYGEPISKQEVEDRFRRGTIHKIFNPVDVKRVRSIAGLSAYLTKYITKQKSTWFACSPWHCSRGVSRLFTKTTVGPSAFNYLMSWKNCKVDKSTGEVFMPRMIRPKGKGAGFCVIVYVNKKDAPLRYLREMEQINKWLIRQKTAHIEGFLDTLDDDIYRKQFCQN